MADFDDVFSELKGAILPLADNMVNKYKDRAKAEVTQFLEDSKETIKLWSKQLIDGDITIEDYESLVLGLKDIAELKILKNAGLAQQRVGQFIGSVLNTLVDIALKRLVG
jgi:hypothetical protein